MNSMNPIFAFTPAPRYFSSLWGEFQVPQKDHLFSHSDVPLGDTAARIPSLAATRIHFIPHALKILSASLLSWDEKQAWQTSCRRSGLCLLFASVRFAQDALVLASCYSE